jgi:hypothetical protein
MGVRIVHDGDNAALYCSTTEWAFGPLFSSDDNHDAEERAQAFCRWLGGREPRRMSDQELAHAYGEWLAQEVTQWANEEGEAIAEEMS